MGQPTVVSGLVRQFVAWHRRPLADLGHGGLELRKAAPARAALELGEVLDGADQLLQLAAGKLVHGYLVLRRQFRGPKQDVLQATINNEASSSGAITIESWPAAMVMNDQVLSFFIRL
jgi:hypothetical protein